MKHTIASGLSVHQCIPTLSLQSQAERHTSLVHHAFVVASLPTGLCSELTISTGKWPQRPVFRGITSGRVPSAAPVGNPMWTALPCKHHISGQEQVLHAALRLWKTSGIAVPGISSICCEMRILQHQKLYIALKSASCFISRCVMQAKDVLRTSLSMRSKKLMGLRPPIAFPRSDFSLNSCDPHIIWAQLAC